MREMAREGGDDSDDEEWNPRNENPRTSYFFPNSILVFE